MTEAPLAFDRQVGLADMLRSVPRAALEQAFAHSLGPAWRIAGTDGATLREGPEGFDAPGATVALVIDIETVGTVSAPVARADALRPAAAWLELLLGASNRYRMAAELHLETVHADHRALMAKHAALTESEERYRILNAELEERVRQQVAVIEQTQRRMAQAEKMASVGNLAAGMAHEINNPIGFMRSNLSTAKSYLETLVRAATRDGAVTPDSQLAFVIEDFASLLDESIGGADRVGRIIADLKAYANTGASLRDLADPNDAVRAAQRMLGPLPDGVTLELQCGPVPRLVCDIDALARAVLALLLNARAAMAGRSGQINVTSAVSGAELAIAVADQGCGVDPAIASQIFDPFFTTHDVGGGMGLGLTVAADVVRAHDGQIVMAPNPGGGSIFTIRIALPAGAGL
jgi:two-component system, NtrC family, sensor kinase